MKKIYMRVIICGIALGVFSFITYKTSNMIGVTNEKLSEFVFLDSDGKSIKYKANENTNRILYVISNTCEACRNSLKWLSQQDENTQKKVDLVSLSDINETRELIKEYNIKSPYYIDNKKSTVVVMKVDSIPTVALNSNGVYKKTSLSIQDAVKK